VVRGNHYRFSTFTASGANPEWDTDFFIPLANWNGPFAASIIVWDKERDIKVSTARSCYVKVRVKY
jgi:hypothetical protein